MIKIKTSNPQKIKNFWNHCHFHPTDAVEDPWGKRILDRISYDRSIDTVRIYTMFEDIAYLDGNGKICYDFRLNDLRLDYMIEKGFNLLLSYNFMPECIAKNKNSTSTVCKNKTRYKGKTINTSVPSDYLAWEELCFEYTKHILQRYGTQIVSKWYLQCFNEPDIPQFFMSELEGNSENTLIRLAEYCKLYEAFEKGVMIAGGEKLRIGGPALAGSIDFFEDFLNYVNKKGLKLDFLSLHNYGTNPVKLSDGTCPLSVKNNVNKHLKYLDVIRAKGFDNTEIIYDEWGASTAGFFNREDAPELMFRETEVFSAYYVKLIYEFLKLDGNISKMLICLSGQHEMTEDFSGFRNFFTLNFIAKPIYNAYVLASKLHDTLIESESENQNVSVISTKNANGKYAVLMVYCAENFDENLPDICEDVNFEENLEGKTLKIYRIDKETTNPYRLYVKMNVKQQELTPQDLALLRNEGNIKPVSLSTLRAQEHVSVKMSANSVVLITIDD